MPRKSVNRETMQTLAQVCTAGNNVGLATFPILSLYGTKNQGAFLRDVSTQTERMKGKTFVRPAVSKTDPRITLKRVPFSVSKGVLCNLQPKNENGFPVSAIRFKDAQQRLARLLNPPKAKAKSTGKGKSKAKTKPAPKARRIVKARRVTK